MNPDWLKDAALATTLKVWSCKNSFIPDDDSPIGLRHVEDMLTKIIKGQVTGEQACVWLGWAQAIICVGNGATMDEFRAINRKAKE